MRAPLKGHRDRHLASSPTHLYWFDPDDRAVMQLAKSGGAPSAIFRTSHSARGIAADARGVCVALGDRGEGVASVLEWVPADGGASRGLCELLCYDSAPLLIAIDATGIYWAEQNTVRTISP